MIGESYGKRRRVLRALVLLVINTVLWILVPSLISSEIVSLLPSTPLASLSFIYAFGAMITGLQVLGALTEGMVVSVPFFSGSYVASAYYLWVAGEGGVLSTNVQGLQLTIEFRLLLFLLVLASLFNAARAPLYFLLHQSEVSRPAPDEF